MPNNYYVIIFKDETRLSTTSTKMMENAKNHENVKSIIHRELTITGWKEHKIK